MKRLNAALVATIALLSTASGAKAAAGQTCRYVLGFETLARALPDQVGGCLDDQAFAANGDALQHTTGGLLAWRKADNWTAFTDGYRTWVNGPTGIQERLNTERFPWEADGLTYSLAPTSTAPFTKLVASWNAVTPPGTWIDVQARAEASGAWTKWYSLGVWASDTSAVQRHSVAGQRDDQVSVDTDTLELQQAATAYQLQAELHPSSTGAIPVVSSLSATTFATAPSAGDASVWGTSLPVPAQSQMLAAYRGLGFGGGGEVWCSATSTSMLLAYWAQVLNRPDLRQPIPAVAAGVYDYAYQGTGNWPFNVAYAANFGLAGYVSAFPDLHAIEPWIKARVPLAISIAFQPGQLDGAPIASTAGHLVVVRGFTAAGDVVVNDPAAPADGLTTTYNRAQLQRAWQTGSGGIAYVIYPPGWPVPS